MKRMFERQTTNQTCKVSCFLFQSKLISGCFVLFRINSRYFGSQRASRKAVNRQFHGQALRRSVTPAQRVVFAMTAAMQWLPQPGIPSDVHHRTGVIQVARYRFLLFSLQSKQLLRQLVQQQDRHHAKKKRTLATYAQARQASLGWRDKIQALKVGTH